jgi:hypothetical protein
MRLSRFWRLIRARPRSDPGSFRAAVIRFVQARSTGVPGEYTMGPGGQVTLYASCFAAMTQHYLNGLQDLSAEEKQAWAAYLINWQDADTGLFPGPEITQGQLTSPKHDQEHLAMHLAAHVLPALHLLGGRPKYPLKAAHRFLDRSYLLDWLNRRDWKDAWLEGNNLLFVGQFLAYLRDYEQRPEAGLALDLYFDWLDAQQDPSTGLWGTNGLCSNFAAMCGGYHQLIVYNYCRRPVHYKEALLDATLALQHEDGGFAPRGGGGACEDVDAVDILVKMYEQTDYRHEDVRQALRRALKSILQKHLRDGGFVYRWGRPFVHMGMTRTATPANTSNLFATWFRVHTIALICQVLQDEPLAGLDWQFNTICSMGWHQASSQG